MSENNNTSISTIFKNGLIAENPVFFQLIGMCPTLGVTSSAINGFGMGIATTAVLIMSNFFISLIRKFIPDEVRIPAFIVVIASFVTVISFLLKAYLPDLDKSLGLFIPLIVVNCLILARAEAFASKNSPIASLVDGLAMGLGFTLALTIIGLVREFIGVGTLFGFTILPEFIPDTLIMILPPGAFFTLGTILALLKFNSSRKGGKK
ncbi:MAG: electron transport complex subunit RsxE [Lachnospirales bacterium]